MIMIFSLAKLSPRPNHAPHRLRWGASMGYITQTITKSCGKRSKCCSVVHICTNRSFSFQLCELPYCETKDERMSFFSVGSLMAKKWKNCRSLLKPSCVAGCSSSLLQNASVQDCQKFIDDEIAKKIPDEYPRNCADYLKAACEPCWDLVKYPLSR